MVQKDEPSHTSLWHGCPAIRPLHRIAAAADEAATLVDEAAAAPVDEAAAEQAVVALAVAPSLN